jgi:hypothetical protein
MVEFSPNPRRRTVMQITLTEAEVSALLEALNSYLPDLREELGKTENYDWRQSLHAQEQVLTGLIAKLGGSIATTNTPDIGANNPPWGGAK